MGRAKKNTPNKVWMKIEYLRRMRGYSQDELCERLNISRSTWNNRSRNVDQITLRELQILAQLFSVGIGEILA